MGFELDQFVSISEINQNFSVAIKRVDEKGQAIILKNNKPLYVMMTMDEYYKLLEKE